MEINRNPSSRDLRWFGVLFAVFCGIVGGILWWRFGWRNAAITIWCIGGAVAIVYYAAPPLRRSIFIGWLYVVFPIGWLISVLLMAIIFYLIITPIGLVMRLVGRDPLGLKPDRDASSLWIRRPPPAEQERYFRQF